MNGTRYYGFLGFLSDLFCVIKEELCLSFATKTFVKAYVSNLSRSLPDKELIYIYGRALWLTNAAVQDPIECVKDSTVIAAWLFGIREVVVNSNKTCSVPAPEAYHIHSQGLASLLRLRGSNQFFTRRGRNLFWITSLFISLSTGLSRLAGGSRKTKNLYLPFPLTTSKYPYSVGSYGAI
ncbi:hypothetical protein BDZ45DRAFT_731376 [Acephala macrosclerotiorum]|nr:hypothetical protein BDZ45DRAFT_731376 [Acephala macrosclerotiorum]